MSMILLNNFGIGRKLFKPLTPVSPDLVSTWMGDHLQMDKPSRHVTSHPGQLSLAIPPWVGAMSTSESWDMNR